MAITITCLILDPGAPWPARLPGRSGAAAPDSCALVAFSCGRGTTCGARSAGGGLGVRPQATQNSSAQLDQRRMSLSPAQREFEQRAQLRFAERDGVRFQTTARALDHAADVDWSVVDE